MIPRPFIEKNHGRFGLKVFAYLAATALFVSLALGVFFTLEEHRRLKENLLLRGQASARLLAQTLRVAVFAEDPDSVARSLEAVAGQEGVLRVGVFTEKGDILGQWAAPSAPGPLLNPAVVARKLSVAQDDLFVEEGEGIWEFCASISSSPEQHSRESLFFGEAAQRPAGSPQPIGFVTITFSKAPYEQEALAVLRHTLPLAVFLGVLCALATILVVRAATAPLAHLARQMGLTLSTDGRRGRYGFFTDPFGRLLGDLNHSFAALQILNERLEARIQERTRALDQANERLEERVKERTRELLAAQNQLLHAEKLAAMGRLTTSLAHEFNNPLCGIRNVLEGVRRRLDEASEDRELVDLAIDEINRMARLLSSMKRFQSPSSDDFTPIPLDEAVTEMLALCKKDLTDYRIDVAVAASCGKPIRGVADQVRQVILNLLQNSISALAQKEGPREIRIEMRERDTQVELQVWDSGVGIPEEHLDKIFEPFFTTKASADGSGLGLAVTQNIVARHKGRIEVASAPSEGTAFSVYFPKA